jgi:hypothetical protein
MAQCLGGFLQTESLERKWDSLSSPGSLEWCGTTRNWPGEQRKYRGGYLAETIKAAQGLQ